MNTEVPQIGYASSLLDGTTFLKISARLKEIEDVDPDFDLNYFRTIDNLVDVKFNEGWYCGRISFVHPVMVTVDFFNGDPYARLKPISASIRACRHDPQFPGAV